MDELEYQLNAIRGVLIFHHAIIKRILNNPLILEQDPALKRDLASVLALVEEHLQALLIAHHETAEKMKKNLLENELQLPPNYAILLGEFLQKLEMLDNQSENNDNTEEE